MIKLNLSLELGGYTTIYTAELVAWPTAWPTLPAAWLADPIVANVKLRLALLALEVKVGLEIHGFIMEFTLVKTG
jgi:hypothetical protein